VPPNIRELLIKGKPSSNVFSDANEPFAKGYFHSFGGVLRGLMLMLEQV